MLSIIDFINNIFKHSDIIDRKVNEQPKDLQHQNLIKQYKYNFVFIEHERCQQLLKIIRPHSRDFSHELGR